MGKVSLDFITIKCNVIFICLSLFRANNMTDLMDHFPRRNKVVERLRKSILKKEKDSVRYPGSSEAGGDQAGYGTGWTKFPELFF